MKQETIEYGLAAVIFATLLSFYFFFVSPYLSELVEGAESFKANIASMGPDSIPKDKLEAYLDSELKTFRALSAVWIGIQFVIFGAAAIWLTGIGRMARSFSLAREE
mgnify:CR=1 FL=1|tara:strand:+ start:10436 stop:10756 length:321 start_codon:yes stop_codon:yes gene_type:complete